MPLVTHHLFGAPKLVFLIGCRLDRASTSLLWTSHRRHLWIDLFFFRDITTRFEWQCLNTQASLGTIRILAQNLLSILHARYRTERGSWSRPFALMPLSGIGSRDRSWNSSRYPPNHAIISHSSLLTSNGNHDTLLCSPYAGRVPSKDYTQGNMARSLSWYMYSSTVESFVLKFLSSLPSYS
jgi:hypothetical protein